MKVLGFKEVPIVRLKLGGDFRARLDHPRIIERARSIERLGVLSEPMVRKSDWKVIYGEDRIAAKIKTGATTVLVKLVDCTDDELYEITQTENIHRRHDPEMQREGIRKMVELYERQAEAEPAQVFTEGSGRKITPKGLARLRAAKELGLRPESVRKAEFRAKNAAIKRRAAAAEREQAIEDAKVTTIGMVITDEYRDQLIDIVRSMKQCDQLMRHALGALSGIQERKLPFPPQRLQRLYDDIKLAASTVRMATPASLCPYCKGLPGIQEACATCLGEGWISKQQMNAIPPDLWEEGDGAAIQIHGRRMKVKEYLKTHQATEEEYHQAEVVE